MAKTPQIRVQFRRNERQSQAEVQLGRTRCVFAAVEIILHVVEKKMLTIFFLLGIFPIYSVIGNVHGEIVPPFPDRPTEGFLQFNVELSPMASQNFEVCASFPSSTFFVAKLFLDELCANDFVGTQVGRPTPMAVELARIVERGIRECRALDTEALAIVAGEKVWSITCDVHVVDHGGNLIDCVSLAAIAALMHFRRPEVSVGNGSAASDKSATVYSMDDHAAVPLSLHHIPISISFCFIQPKSGDAEPIIFMDPTDREERITDGRMTFTFNSFRELCAVHKIGGAAISTSDVLRCANVAAARVQELTDFLKAEAEKADQEAIQKRRAMLRGRDFADVSSLSTDTKTNRTEVDLGAMTDFGTLHAPIALRDDPTREETDAKVTSMAELLESLESAAEMTGNEPESSKPGLELSVQAREEFEKLTASLGGGIRALVGNKPTKASEEPATTSNRTDARTKSKPSKKAAVDSDSEEEGVVVQSEFVGEPKPAAEEVKKPAKKASKKSKKKKVESSEDEDEEEDLTAAVKRKGRK